MEGLATLNHLRLTEHNFLDYIPVIGENANPTCHCIVSSQVHDANGKKTCRECGHETCLHCNVSLCVGNAYISVIQLLTL